MVHRRSRIWGLITPKLSVSSLDLTLISCARCISHSTFLLTQYSPRAQFLRFGFWKTASHPARFPRLNGDPLSSLNSQVRGQFATLFYSRVFASVVKSLLFNVSREIWPRSVFLKRITRDGIFDTEGSKVSFAFSPRRGNCFCKLLSRMGKYYRRIVFCIGN